MSEPRTPAGHAEDDGPVPSPFAGLGLAVDRGIARGLTRITGAALGPYQTAIVRIGFALTWLLFLLREFPHRDELYGPDSPWSLDLAKQLVAGNHAFTALLWNDSRGWFELVYAVAIVSSAMLLVGWRTRTASVLFMIGVLSLQNRSVFMGDGGDNVVHLMAIYLVFTRCGQVWSVDRALADRAAAKAQPASEAAARNEAEDETGSAGRPSSRLLGADPVGIALWVVLAVALVLATAAGKLSTEWKIALWAGLLLQALWWAVRRYAPGEPRSVLDIMANVVHNGAMLVVVVEVCLIYSTAGWYKIQGSKWEDGTALYYPLHLDDFTPWPSLSHALAGNSLMVMLISYGTVIVQVAFPFTLFNRRVKNVLLAAMMLEHASIAVVLGLPFFSLAMIAADAVFLPTGFLRWLGQQVARPLKSRTGPRPAVAIPGSRSADAEAPAEGPPPGEPVSDPI
ncbi:HTTM domain-containing protein [Actinacidiphila epipremni]|uniref:HTTM domain-containing protein n=1 Tax=Actinacidiphila epipremni TaxID=2053013 RepID=UPI0038990124